MKSAKVCWGPSIHRNINGKDDHAMVKCTWSWRLRAVKAGKGVDWSVLRMQPDADTADPAPAVPTHATAACVASALASLNYTEALFGERINDSVLDSSNPSEGGEVMSDTEPSALCLPKSVTPRDDRMRGNCLVSTHSDLAVQTSACANVLNIPNLSHVSVRGGHPKNGDPLLTHAPNASELSSLAMKVAGALGVQTKPLEGGDGAMVEGRYAQYHRCPDPPDNVRGRDMSLADSQVTVKSRALMLAEQQHDECDTHMAQHLVGKFVMTQRNGHWQEGRVVAPIAQRFFLPPRWIIQLEDDTQIVADMKEVQRWSNAWSSPHLYFCTPVCSANH